MHCYKTDVSIDLINFSESHTQSQPFRPLPCDDYHDHNFLTYICSAVVARLLVLACGTARMQVWNGINLCSGCVGRTCNDSDLNDDVAWAQPFPVLHARNVPALLDFNSFPEPHIHIQSFTPLPWVGVRHQTLLCLYVNYYERDSHRMAGAWSVGFGYGIQSNGYGQLKHVHFISMHLIPIWLTKWLSMIPGMAIGCF